MSQNNKIFGALANIQEYLLENPIEKSKYNSFSKYNYRGIDDVYASLAKPLAMNKVTTNFLPDLKVRTRLSEDGKTSYSLLKGTLRFLSLEDGSYVDTAYVGQSKSTQGRDLEAAKSFAYRDALIQFFCVPFEQTVEPEMVGDEDEPAEEKIFDMFVSEISKVTDKTQQEKIFRNYDKVATLAGDKEAREKINLHYTKMAGAK
jgi:hypothetical protein